MKHIPPSTNDRAFNCPHCGVLTTQFWHEAYVAPYDENAPLPPSVGRVKALVREHRNPQNPSNEKWLADLIGRIQKGHPFVRNLSRSLFPKGRLHNVYVSTCYNCEGISLWIHDKLFYPQRGEAPPANPDLSPDVRRDYDEASAILGLFLRGAAALIRLAIQKLCKELGQSGNNLNGDIKALVEAGLDERIQQALDTVRVIGNHAVHPGAIDLKDDRKAAETLFELLNLIAEKMISEPKRVGEMYDSLPQKERDAINKRDKK